MPIQRPTDEEMGICARLPGIQDAIDELHTLKERLLEKLTRLRAARGEMGEAVEQSRRGRPPKLLGESVREAISKTNRYGWSDDPEERKAEMARRMRAHADKVVGKSGGHKLHPRDPNHPGHDAWVAKMRRTQRRVWNALTPEQRAERQAKMTAGKRRAA